MTVQFVRMNCGMYFLCPNSEILLVIFKCGDGWSVPFYALYCKSNVQYARGIMCTHILHIDLICKSTAKHCTFHLLIIVKKVPQYPCNENLRPVTSNLFACLSNSGYMFFQILLFVWEADSDCLLGNGLVLFAVCMFHHSKKFSAGVSLCYIFYLIN